VKVGGGLMNGFHGGQGGGRVINELMKGKKVKKDN